MKPVPTSSSIGSAVRMLHITKIRNMSATFNVWQRNRKLQTINHELSTLRNFSGYTRLNNKEQKNEELPSFSFEGLGMSRNVKVFVIVVLSIFGTIETWVWCKGIYRWWNGPSEKEKKQA
ncbi:hypothetical protein T069G_07757 [Trichoderma breve]|uniref:Transmembrane protein n=1 Tax=Trichoderma breve TaxID=2034170 RepID=A0A9W9BAN5_9HYPO|nr:hypothetical protein T069G_07757 [Trichoderma breve]KAJ4856860.1 hypothetical protein T069G_07757 [Trichoderma breve]